MKRLFLASIAGLLTGCYVPGPKAHAELQISTEGLYTFNGHPASPQDLESLVEAAKTPGADLVVQVVPAPTTDMAAVRYAVAAIKTAHARVAFVHGTPAQ